MPADVPAGTLVLRNGEPSGVVSVAKASSYRKLNDPRQPGRTLDRDTHTFSFYAKPEQTVGDAAWTLLQRTPCGDRTIPIVLAEPLSKEQEDAARDAAKTTENPRRVLNHRRVFLDFEPENPKRFGKELRAPTSVYYFPPKEQISSSRFIAKETIISVGAAELRWGKGVSVSGSGAFSRVVFDVWCDPDAAVKVDGRELGNVRGQKKRRTKKPPGVLVVNELVDCLRTQTARYDDINRTNAPVNASGSGKPTFFARETDPVVALPWRSVSHVLRWDSRRGTFNELDEATAERCK
ncbi:MAG: hypothetical protein AAGA54_24990 [Myxococcota bacterium]